MARDGTSLGARSQGRCSGSFRPLPASLVAVQDAAVEVHVDVGSHRYVVPEGMQAGASPSAHSWQQGAESFGCSHAGDLAGRHARNTP